MLDGAGLDPSRPRRWSALHEKEIAADAVGIALHHHGPVGQMRQQNRGDVNIELEKVGLGNSEIRPEDFAQIGQAHGFAAGVEVHGIQMLGNASAFFDYVFANRPSSGTHLPR